MGGGAIFAMDSQQWTFSGTVAWRYPGGLQCFVNHLKVVAIHSCQFALGILGRINGLEIESGDTSKMTDLPHCTTPRIPLTYKTDPQPPTNTTPSPTRKVS